MLAQVSRLLLVAVIGVDSWVVIEGSVVRGLFPIMLRCLQGCAAFDVLLGTWPVELLLLRLLLRFRVLLLRIACAASLLA